MPNLAKQGKPSEAVFCVLQLKKTTTPIYQLTVLQVRSLSWHGWVLCSGYDKTENKVQSRLNFSTEALGKIPLQVHSYCWLNSVSCSYRTEVHNFICVVSHRPLSETKGCLHSLPCQLLPTLRPPEIIILLLNPSHALNL